jgi:hypothetical protein
MVDSTSDLAIYMLLPVAVMSVAAIELVEGCSLGCKMLMLREGRRRADEQGR